MGRATRSFVFAAIAFCACRAWAAEPLQYTGQVYDLDVTIGRDRVVAMILNESGNLVAETSSLGTLGVLQTALMLGRQAEVAYEPGIPNRILAARVTAAGPARSGHVQELKFDERKARLEAHILFDGSLVVAVTKDPRAQAILQTAMREGRPLEDVQYDADTGVLDRVVLRILR